MYGAGLMRWQLAHWAGGAGSSPKKGSRHVKLNKKQQRRQQRSTVLPTLRFDDTSASIEHQDQQWEHSESPEDLREVPCLASGMSLARPFRGPRTEVSTMITLVR